LTGRRARKLIEANEQLVMTALRAQVDAEAATHKLEVLSRSSELDALTDLPNRQSLLSRFTYAIAIARRTGTQLALLFIDLNNFKQINDTLGHAVGDQVLRLAAKRLATAVRQSDTVSRHGGDEFLILLTDVSDPNDVVRIAINLIAALGRPARVGEHVLRLTASIGISLFPHDGEHTETLIQRADAAMYRAKRSGEGGFAFYGSGTSLDEDHTASPVLSALHHPLSHYRAALAEQARRHAQLRDANEQLVLAALSAQHLQEAAEQTQRRQMEFSALLVHELLNPLVPGKLRLERRLVDLRELLDAVVAACRPSMDARLQHFTVQIPTVALDCYGDPVRLAQIVSNLLDNASKYSKEGADIGLSVTQAEDSIVITVSDTGIGMSAHVLCTIFEPFVQDATAIEFNGTGLGIGLTVVRELVAAHGGTIIARSAGAGSGSSFAVTLPRQSRGPMPSVTDHGFDAIPG
jgi:diguanylate cyclase (GGDEF)-like protein